MRDEFEHFRSAFLIQHAEDIHRGLQTVFARSVRLSPTLLSGDVQLGFMSSLSDLMLHQQDASVSWGFHGTDPANLQSIYKHGLLIPGMDNDVKVAHGEVYGRGIYIANATAAWLSTRFCCSTSWIHSDGQMKRQITHTPQLLVCAVLQSSAVKQGGADAKVVFDARHVVPLFLAEADQFFHEIEHWWMLPLPAPTCLRSLMEASSQHRLVLSCASATALSKVGASAVALRWSGCSASELKKVGFSVDALQVAGYEVAALLGAGYADVDVMRAGFSSAALREAGCAASALQEAGFSASDLISAGYTDHEVLSAGCTISALKKAGYSASVLKQNGYSADAMKEADEKTRRGIWECCYSVNALRRAGYSAAELISAGYSLRDLKAAGYRSRDVMQACDASCCAQCASRAIAEFKGSGYTAHSLKLAAYSAVEVHCGSCMASAPRKAGCCAAAKKGWQCFRKRVGMETVLWLDRWRARVRGCIRFGMRVFCQIS
eukprot:TRINITY_DN103105_c0_g1_i1.p1 TRINITY_DN103105_c0_g1~~TRINITY_DN103105_c0_g1_i1.p1  ORF type:complete len:514 (+),score=66.53 TRINITY_DN103105_c0_g1_i1:71-1543(+)